jgi:hypothetical protein
MKSLIYLSVVLVLIFTASCGSDKPDKLPSSNQRKTADKETVDTAESKLVEYSGLPIDSDSAEVIFTGGTDKDKQFVFIDKRKKSDYYEKITNVELSSKFETTQYRKTYSEILKNYTENYDANKFENINLPKKWMELKYYESAYYVYCPAREEENLRIKITDSAIMIFENTGVIAERISGYEKIDDNHSLISTASISGKSNMISKEINIYLIDREKHVYIWEVFSPSGLIYKLMIPVEYARKFPIIINYGEKSVPEEFDFDEINYFEEISKLI